MIHSCSSESFFMLCGKNMINVVFINRKKFIYNI